MHGETLHKYRNKSQSTSSSHIQKNNIWTHNKKISNELTQLDPTVYIKKGTVLNIQENIRK